MLIRPLVPTDAAAYRALMLDAYARTPEAFTSSAEERAALPIGWWTDRLDPSTSAPQRVMGAFDDAQLIGAAGLLFEARGKSRHKAELFGMYVSGQARAKGFGRALVEKLIEVAVVRGITVVQLTVTQGNDAAQRLYERCGFESFGVEPCAVRIDGRYLSKIHMWRRIDGA